MSLTLITGIKAAQRLDSRGNPTVQVDLQTTIGSFRALVPSGASTGQHEAVELRDGDKTYYNGKGVLNAVANVNKVIGPLLIADAYDLRTQLKDVDEFLRKLDGTKNKSKRGANAILGVSMACARAGAAELGIPLYEFLRKESGRDHGPYAVPVPFLNVLNGGVHSGNTMAFQEIMIAPVGAESFEEGIRMAAEVYHKLKGVISDRFGAPATGIGEPEQAFDLLEEAISACKYKGRIKFAMDPASVKFYRPEEGIYDIGFKCKEPNPYTPFQLQLLYSQLIASYPLVLLKDPFSEDDWESWAKFNETCPIELVGDELLATNVEKVKLASEKKACNAMLLKVNQIRTVTEAISAVFVSHRSGETTDDFIADLTVGLGTGHLKSGSPCRGERVAKYNWLMDIEAELREKGRPYVYTKTDFRFPSKLSVQLAT
ncbi:enolase [Podospora fimiseda]|uniref:phosphopyruvate hydratase n=1 Tax=Podospora fimiseda TaxID=252190 RepID=A0AAN7BRC8_9PEZI|nr:enolase [Podospora fimiseda]